MVTKLRSGKVQHFIFRALLWLKGLGGSRKSVWLPWGWEEKKRIGADRREMGVVGFASY